MTKRDDRCGDVCIRVLEGNFVRILSWYDNEWGFSNRMADTAVAFAKLIWITDAAFGRYRQDTDLLPQGRGFCLRVSRTKVLPMTPLGWERNGSFGQ